MSASFRWSRRWGLASVLFSATFSAVTHCKALSVIEIPTGPFCDGCVVTNVYYYSPDDVLDWSRDLSLDVAEIRAECETLRTSINRLAFGYESYSLESLISKTTTDILWYSEHSVDSYDEENILDTLQDYQRLLRTSQHQASVQLSDLTTIQTQLNELDLYASDVVPEYTARFAVACTGGTNDVCCACPDYTPYFVTLTNRVTAISGHVANLRTYVQTFYNDYVDISSLLESDFGWPMSDVLSYILAAKLRQIGGGYSEFDSAWESWTESPEGSYWSYPVTSHAVMSNLMASTHLYPNGIQTSLAIYGSTYEQHPTWQTLESMPMLDRITVLLRRVSESSTNTVVNGISDEVLDALKEALSGLNVEFTAGNVQAYAEANAEATAEAEANAAQEELDLGDQQEQEAITDEVEEVAKPDDVSLTSLVNSLRNLVNAFDCELPSEIVILKPDESEWIRSGMAINIRQWSGEFRLIRNLVRCGWAILLLSISGRVVRVYGVAVASCARLAYGVAQGDVHDWSSAWSEFVNTWAGILGSVLGG